jgi:hypothetical protein
LARSGRIAAVGGASRIYCAAARSLETKGRLLK